MNDTKTGSTQTAAPRARLTSRVSWLLAAITLGTMGWNGRGLKAQEFFLDDSVAQNMQILWNIHAIACVVLLICWIPLGIGWRALPMVATAICAMGGLVAVFGIAFFRDTGLGWLYVSSAIILGICALVQLAVRFPRR